MWISKRVYEDLKAEHQRTVEALSAWIEYLQATAGAPTAPRMAPAGAAGASLPPDFPPDMAYYVSDEEQDLRDAHEMGLIDDENLQEGLRQLAIANS